MMIYIFILIALVVMAKSKKIGFKVFMMLSGLCVFCLMALRSYTVGTDSLTYVYLYKITAEGGKTLIYDKAPLFHYLMKYAAYLLGTNGQCYFVITALLIVLPIWVGVYWLGEEYKNAIVLYYLLFFQQSLNGTRTFVSMSLVFLAYVLCEKRRYCRAVFFLLAAVAIHKIAIVGLPIIMTPVIVKAGKRVEKFVVVMWFICCVSLKLFITLFSSVFGVYKETLSQVTDKVGGSAYLFHFLILIVVLWGVENLRILKKESDTYVLELESMWLVLFFGITLFALAGNKWYVQRVLQFFDFFAILLIPRLIKNKSKYRIVFYYLVLLLGVGLFLYGIIRNLNDIYPYRFCF